MIILLIFLLSHQAIITNQVQIPIEKSSCMQGKIHQFKKFVVKII